MTQTGKGVIALSAVSALGGVGAYAGGLFDKPKPIIKRADEPFTIVNTTKDRLGKEGFELLSTNEDSDEWKKVLDDYVKANVKPFTSVKDASKDQPKLREECENQLKLKTEESYKISKKWCVKKSKVSEILSKNYTILNSEQEVVGEKDSWAQNVEALKKAPEKFKTLKEKIKQPEEPQKTNVAILKEECKKLKEKETFTTSEEFDDVFEQMRNYCSVKKNGNN